MKDKKTLNVENEKMISILMSTHNPIDKYFKLCLDSIYNQTHKNFEIVLIDDCSDEEVISFIKNNNYDISKINYIRLNENVGLPRALNIGLKECKGDYIARMDDDDVMDITRLEKQLKLVEENNLAGCFSWFNLIDSNDNTIGQKSINISSYKYLKQLLGKGNVFCHSSLFVKKDILNKLDGYDENLRYAQDCDLYIRLLEKNNMGMVEEYLVDHRINDYRNNKYRETLSLTYSLFGVMRHLTSGKNVKKKHYIYAVSRILRYFVGIVKIAKK